MKTITYCRCEIYLLWMLLTVMSLNAQVTDVGGIARNFTVTNHHSGKPISLYAYAGSIVVLDFFAYWCGPCRASSPDLEQNVQKYFSAQGGNSSGIPVQVLAVNIEPANPSLTDDFIATAGLELVADDFRGVAWNQFNTANGIPLFVIINGAANSSSHKQWEVLHRKAGYSGAAYMRDVINSIKAKASPKLLASKCFMGQTGFSMAFTSQPGLSYLTEVSADLKNWQILKRVTANGTQIGVVDAEAPRVGKRYYRVRVE